MSFTKFDAQYGSQLLDYDTKTMRRRTSNQKSSSLISKFASLLFGCYCLLFCLVPVKSEKVKSFHDTIGPVILLGNIFSIFPVAGIFSKSVENLRFKLFYPITIYSIIIQLCFMIELVLLFVFLSKTGLNFFMVGEFCLSEWKTSQSFLFHLNRQRFRSNNLHTCLYFWRNLLLLSINEVA